MLESDGSVILDKDFFNPYGSEEAHNAYQEVLNGRGYNPNRDDSTGRFTFGDGGGKVRKFNTTDAAFDYISSQSAPKHTQEEKSIVEDYQGYEFDHFNEIARTGTMDVSFYDLDKQADILARNKERVRILEDVATRSKIPEAVKTYRIVNSRRISDPTDPRIYGDKGFMSTSINKEFINKNKDDWQGKPFIHVLEIDVPAGTPGLYVNTITDRKRTDSYGIEAELLLGRAVDLEYVSHERRGRINYVKARIKK